MLEVFFCILVPHFEQNVHQVLLWTISFHFNFQELHQTSQLLLVGTLLGGYQPSWNLWSWVYRLVLVSKKLLDLISPKAIPASYQYTTYLVGTWGDTNLIPGLYWPQYQVCTNFGWVCTLDVEQEPRFRFLGEKKTRPNVNRKLTTNSGMG
jgi:hypothetical protein